VSNDVGRARDGREGQEQPVQARWVGLVVVAVALAVYVRTLAPTITWAHHGADGGDLITAVVTRGVPHPTGYPTYLLLGRLFLRVPWGDAARRLNLMSAVFAALTVGLLYLTVLSTLRLFGEGEIAWRERVLAAASALAFAFSPLLWSQALIAEVYALNVFFVALTIVLVLGWVEKRRPALLGAAALVFGLGLGNHLTLVLLGPALALLLLLSPRGLPGRVRHLALIVVAFLLGLSVYAILPLRASHHPPVNWGDPRTVDRFLWLVTGRLYRRYFFSLPARYLPARLSAWAGLLVRQFGWWGLFLGLVGIWSFWRRARRAAIFSAAIVLVYSTYAVAYDTSDSHVYLLPVFLMFALWMAWGIDYLLAEVQRLWPPDASGLVRALPRHLVLVIPMLSLLGNFAALDASSTHEAHDYGVEVLETVAPQAIIIPQTDPHTFTLNYFRYAEDRRPDVALLDGQQLYHAWYRQSLSWIHPDVELPERVIAVAGEGSTCVPSRLVAAIQLNWERRPTYLTDPEDEIRACFRLAEEGPVYRVIGYREG
jgi:hypothetical protein